MSDQLSSMQESRLSKALELTRQQLILADNLTRSISHLANGAAGNSEIIAIAQILSTNYQTQTLGAKLG